MQNSEGKMTYKEYLLVLKECSPYDFCEYSDNSIDRRIQKIMRDYHLTMDELIHKTRNDEAFVELVVEAITVNTTELFRDPPVWKFIRENVLPAFKNRPKINIWHAGCSTGQEVYSMMILLHEAGIFDKAEIYASDISKKALENAKKGAYKYSFNHNKYQENLNAAFADSVVPKITDFFEISKESDQLIIKPFLKTKTKFVRHDLVKQELPFYSKFDIIFCRNVLIYFNGGLQSRIVQCFHDNLFPGGVMVLGTHETLNGFFKTKFAKKGPVYSRTNTFHFKY
ncbi:CheR family methyltransferase [Natronoflexus pectinivorans]|uniref:Chemotaxis protein methyltransferase CheR n=1 Tax=Natronoflexus pectinivorans TaxID=682526 RepID=A0A4R2GNS6_9BACT|nr:protein-glutamate O-methyltransferase CheR [Natronoflexus pectinivorans]TCO10943.1 chemotaxis protein methyltransferase CheR [Natronoflexus pectinivorans]